MEYILDKGGEKKIRSKKYEVKRLYDEGITYIEDLMKETGLVKRTIKGHCKELGIEYNERTTENMVLELYNPKENNINEIARKLKKSQRTIYRIVNKLKRDGKMQKDKSSEDKIKELHNEGVTYIEDFMEKTGLEERTIKRHCKELGIEYKNRARGKARIQELYDEGVTYIEDLMEKTGLTERTIKEYCKDLGLKYNKRTTKTTKTTKDMVLELYNPKEDNIDEIARKLQKSPITIQKIVYNLKRDGKIQKNKSQKDKIKELHNEGVTYIEDLAEKTGFKEATIITCCSQLGLIYYRRSIIEKRIIKSAIKTIKKELKDDTPESKLRDLYSLGIIDINILMQKTGLSMNDINKYISNNILNEQEIQRMKILKGLTEKFPMDLAKRLNIKLYKLYDIIDGITEIGKQEILIQSLKKQKYIYEKIFEISKDKKASLQEIIKQIETEEESEKGLLQLSYVCYILNNEKECQRIAKKVEYKTQYEPIKRLAKEIGKRYKSEFLAREIRNEYKKSLESGKEVSYDSICKKYNATRSFVESVVGKEARDR